MSELSHASKVVNPGRVFLSQMVWLSTVAKQLLDHPIHLIIRPFAQIYVTFYRSRWMLELKFAITEQEVCPHRLLSRCSIGWRITDQAGRLSLNTVSTMNAKARDSPCLHAHNHISNSTILNNNCFVAKWFVCMRTIFENGIANEAIVLQWLVRTTSGDFKVVKSDGLVHCSV